VKTNAPQAQPGFAFSAKEVEHGTCFRRMLKKPPRLSVKCFLKSRRERHTNERMISPMRYSAKLKTSPTGVLKKPGWCVHLLYFYDAGSATFFTLNKTARRGCNRLRSASGFTKLSYFP